MQISHQSCCGTPWPFFAPGLTARQARQPMRRHAPRPGRSSTTGTNEPDDQTTTTPHMARDDATTMLRPDHCAQLGRLPGVRGRAPYLWRQQGWRTTTNLGHHPKEGHANAWAGRGRRSKTDRAGCLTQPFCAFSVPWRVLRVPSAQLDKRHQETPQRHQSRRAPSTAQRTAAAARSRRLYRLERDLQP